MANTAVGEEDDALERNATRRCSRSPARLADRPSSWRHSAHRRRALSTAVGTSGWVTVGCPSLPSSPVAWRPGPAHTHPALVDAPRSTLAATRIRRFLEAEPIVWVSTVRPDGTPHLIPIWFWWDGEALLVFSKPDAQKVRNLRANPSVMLALGDVEDDFDVGLVEGRAELLDAPDVRGPPRRTPGQVRSAARRHRDHARGLRRDVLAGHPHRARGLPRLARPDDAARPAARRGAVDLDRGAAPPTRW